MTAIPTCGAPPTDTTRSPAARWRTLDGSAVTIEDGLWARRQVTNRDAALPHGYRMLEVEGHAVDPARYNLMAISPSITGIFTLPPERRPA